MRVNIPFETMFTGFKPFEFRKSDYIGPCICSKGILIFDSKIGTLIFCPYHGALLPVYIPELACCVHTPSNTVVLKLN